ncbi:unnamed protein product [Effrenium voratum]|uniref:Heat shock protein 70 n=1 Tax=Effrenium voratum TaxID=2562239 RepID=A0AA36ID37_9DINO|nr:unnamed protein product [Effrenium voratum]
MASKQAKAAAVACAGLGGISFAVPSLRSSELSALGARGAHAAQGAEAAAGGAGAFTVGAATAVAAASARRKPRARIAARAEGVGAPGEKVVGIDLGTTNSALAAVEAGTPTMIPNAEGARTTPSVVAYSKGGELLVGQIAKRQAVVNPENTYSVKRFVGRQPNEVEEELKEVSYKVQFEGRS